MHDKLKKARTKMGASQQDIAYKIGVSNTAIANWERGLCSPTIYHAFKLCKALSISINSLNPDG